MDSEIVGMINIPASGCVTIMLDNGDTATPIAFPAGTVLNDGTISLPSGDELTDGARVNGGGGQVTWSNAGLDEAPASCREAGEDVIVADSLSAN